MHKYPMIDKYNYNDLITTPNEIKNVLDYLEYPNSGGQSVSSKYLYTNQYLLIKIS
jgi:hypothetical protein